MSNPTDPKSGVFQPHERRARPDEPTPESCSCGGSEEDGDHPRYDDASGAVPQPPKEDRRTLLRESRAKAIRDIKEICNLLNGHLRFQRKCGEATPDNVVEKIRVYLRPGIIDPYTEHLLSRADEGDKSEQSRHAALAKEHTLILQLLDQLHAPAGDSLLPRLLPILHAWQEYRTSQVAAMDKLFLNH